jgi:hypothetical protein
VQDDLDGGVAVVLQYPATLDRTELELGVSRSFPGHVIESVDVREAVTAADAVAALARHLGVSDAEMPATTSGLVEMGAAAGRFLWFDGFEASGTETQKLWVRVAVELVTAAEQFGYVVPVTVNLSSLRDVAGLEDSPRIRRHRWWDIVGRLDVAVLLNLLEPHIDPIRGGQIIELTAGDLELAEQLAGSSDLAMKDIEQVCRERAKELNLEDEVPAESSVDRSPGLEAAWLRGAFNVVDGMPAWHSGVLACGARKRDLERRVWVSQIRELLPRLDFLRVGVADRAVEHGIIAPWVANEKEVEFGDIARALRRHREHRELSELAAWMHRTRNRLAHLEVVDAAQIGEGRQLAEAAGLRL